MYGMIRWAPIIDRLEEMENFRERRKRFEMTLRDAQEAQSIGRLAEGISHSFNNLLTVILGNASLALEGLTPAEPAYTMVEDVVRAADRAALLVRQLLVYSGRARFHLQSVNLSRLVRDISAALRAAISRHIELRLELSFDLPPVQADSAQIAQLIMDLAINGAEAIGPNKPGLLILTTGIRNVDEEYLRTHVFATGSVRPGRFVMLGVRDTGGGMDEETKSRVFDPFFTTKLAGRGLGMAAVLGVVRGHHGAILVESAPEKGSTFRVFLPVWEASKDLAARSAS